MRNDDSGAIENAFWDSPGLFIVVLQILSIGIVSPRQTRLSIERRQSHV
ncbi:MAG: hypothetical protein KDA81_16780 [Planctomycetaceae bacterium]|nr:hypothetical protein [Planctomycetaceae bacterium]